MKFLSALSCSPMDSSMAANVALFDLDAPVAAKLIELHSRTQRFRADLVLSELASPGAGVTVPSFNLGLFQAFDSHELADIVSDQPPAEGVFRVSPELEASLAASSRVPVEAFSVQIVEDGFIFRGSHRDHGTCEYQSALVPLGFLSALVSSDA